MDGRGTQLFKIADELLKQGYSTIGFDAPAHGKSPGKTTIMVDFIFIFRNEAIWTFRCCHWTFIGWNVSIESIKKGLK
jgi:hypothetical protein